MDLVGFASLLNGGLAQVLIVFLYISFHISVWTEKKTKGTSLAIIGAGAFLAAAAIVSGEGWFGLRPNPWVMGAAMALAFTVMVWALQGKGNPQTPKLDAWLAVGFIVGCVWTFVGYCLFHLGIDTPLWVDFSAAFVSLIGLLLGFGTLVTVIVMGLTSRTPATSQGDTREE